MVPQVDADSMSSSTTVMDLSGGVFYTSFEEVITEQQETDYIIKIIRIYTN